MEISNNLSTYHSLLLQMLRKLLLHDISVSHQYFHYGLGEPLHVPLPDLRVRTLQLGDHVEALGELRKHVHHGVTEESMLT